MTRRLVAYLTGLALTLLALLALVGVVEPEAWLASAALAAAITALAMAAMSLASPRVGAPIAGLIAGLIAATTLYAPRHALLGVLPTPRALSDLWTMVSAGATQAYLATPPTPAYGMIPVFLGACAIVSAIVICAAGAIARWPLAGGALTLGWWGVPVVRGLAPGWWLAVVTGVVFAAYLAAAPRRHDPRPDRLGWAGLGASAAVAAAIALVAGPGLAHLGGSVTPGIDLGGVKVDTGPISLSGSADLYEDLTTPRPRVVMVRDGGDGLGPLRVHVAEIYTGSTWRPYRPSDSSALAPDVVAWPFALEPEGETATMTIELRALGGTSMPEPIAPRQAASDTELEYSPQSDLLSTSSTARGTSVAYTVYPRQLDPEALRAAEPALPPDGGSDLLQVPDSPHAADISALAEQVTAGAPSTYDALVALQDYLRSMRYQVSAPPQDTGDALWDFLQAEAGYCVHFATAFVIMARDLGIPARLAIGYLPRSGDRAEIRSTDAHAWPEVYFDSIGWIAFEPTPSQRTQDVAPAVTPSAEPSATPTATATTTATTSAAASSAPASTSAAPGATDRIGASGVWLGMFLAAAILIAAVVAAWWWRRRRLAATSALVVWRAVRAAARKRGVIWSDSATVRRAGARLADALGTPEAHSDVKRLVTAVEAERYGTGTTLTPAELHHVGTRLRHALRRRR